ncbi:trypsin-like peptidase domain-containing protein [Bradyrhizobium lablabi]|uniref:S1C family serine protease n=1 Tax=Bradyrhizobium lablabi TaxID=722472 RepID=UPI001BA928CB|nr:trypsin-like peptidase domain-containing protein [Bradyrhizobium lablabi]MBR1124511.1 trypsin-like peptidase domain-containing protein [Bradyrhizobium lablabi]
MFKSIVASCLFQIAIVTVAYAAGPFGTIRVGNWIGGAYTDDNGAFSHCAAGSDYASGVSLIVGRNANNGWLLGFGSPRFNFTKGSTTPIDVTFDGQSQARLFATANSPSLTTAILPPNVARDFQKASLMVAVAGGTPLQFNLTSTAPLLAALANCVTRVKADGIAKAGDFSAAKPVAAKPADTPDAAGSGKPKTYGKTGTGFAISANGHVVTNHHVVDGCTGDIKGNLTGEAPINLRLVSGDETNDLALLQAPAGSFKEFAKIRERSIRSGDSVVAIGFPYHGLLTSDFTVTTGIVSSLSGLFNNTRFLQISAAVQPGNSGGPLLDTNGQVVGMVAAKINALKIARATGDIPENINFAIKTGAIRDFLDNSVVPYQVAEPKGEMKTPEIAGAARAFTLLISCTATEKTASAKR